MDLNELHRLIGKPTPELEAQVNTSVSNALTILEQKLGRELIKPEIVYDLKGRTAGWAIGASTIRLNIDLLYTHTESMLDQTVPHEVAHIVQHQIYPGAKGHGRQWQHLMYLLGKPADRCHQYDTKPQRVHDRPFTYVCTNPYCNHIYNLTRGMHAKIKMGSKRVCGKCRSPLMEVQQ